MAGLTVPVIQDSAQLETGTGRRRISASPDAFGAQEAQGAGAVAQGLGQAAQAADEVGQRFDAARALDLDNQLSNRIRQRLYNPDNGYLSTALGRNAIDQRAQTESDIDTIATDLAGQAGNPRAQQLFLRQARARVQSALGEVATHATSQTNAYANQQSEARISEATNNAVAGFSDPTVVASNIDLAQAEVDSVAHRLGWSDEQKAERMAAVRSDINTRAITAMAATDPEGAQARYDAVRPSLSAQDAAQLQTAMRVAQREHVDQIEGAGWQTFANGQSLQSLGANVYHELTTNPLLGASHARLTEAYRTRANSYAAGGRVRDNSPAFHAALLSPTRDLIAPGNLEQYFADHAGELSNGDITRLIQRRDQLSQNGSDVQSQQSAFTALRGVAQGLLQPYGVDLTVSDRSPTHARNLAAAFDAALLREVQNYMRTNGQQPAGQDVDLVIGRAIVGMHDADLQGLSSFRVHGDQGRAGTSGGGAPAIGPTTEAVVPFASIPQGVRRQIASGLRTRLRRNPTLGEVENAYASLLAHPDQPLVQR